MAMRNTGHSGRHHPTHGTSLKSARFSHAQNFRDTTLFTVATIGALASALGAYAKRIWETEPGESLSSSSRHAGIEAGEAFERFYQVNIASDKRVERAYNRGGQNVADSLKKTVKFAQSKRGKKAALYTGYTALGVAALCMIRGYMTPKNPYLDIPLSAKLSPEVSQPQSPNSQDNSGRSSTARQVKSIQEFKNIPSVLVTCYDREQFEIVKNDIEAMRARSNSITLLNPKLQTLDSESEKLTPVDSEGKMYAFRYHMRDTDLRSDTVFVVVNSEECTVRMIEQAQEQLKLPELFKCGITRGHNYQMTPTFQAVKERGLLTKNALVIYGGCVGTQYVAEDAQPSHPILTTEDTGYVTSNNNVMFTTVTALNRSSTSNWGDLQRYIVEKNPLAGPHFIVPGTREYYSLFPRSSSTSE